MGVFPGNIDGYLSTVIVGFTGNKRPGIRVTDNLVVGSNYEVGESGYCFFDPCSDLFCSRDGDFKGDGCVLHVVTVDIQDGLSVVGGSRPDGDGVHGIKAFR